MPVISNAHAKEKNSEGRQKLDRKERKRQGMCVVRQIIRKREPEEETIRRNGRNREKLNEKQKKKRAGD